MFGEADARKLVEKALALFIMIVVLLAVWEASIAFWKNWNLCAFHFSDKQKAYTVECPMLESEFLRQACHRARHELSLSPLLCAFQDTIKDVRRIIWIEELKTLATNFWFGILLAIGCGLVVLYYAMSRGASVSVYYPPSVLPPLTSQGTAWMKKLTGEKLG